MLPIAFNLSTQKRKALTCFAFRFFVNTLGFDEATPLGIG